MFQECCLFWRGTEMQIRTLGATEIPWVPVGGGGGKYKSSAHLSSLVGISTEAVLPARRLALSDHRHPIYKLCLTLGSRAGPSFNLYTLLQCPQKVSAAISGLRWWRELNTCSPTFQSKLCHFHECQRNRTPTHSQQATYGCTPSSSSKELVPLNRVRSLFQLVRSAFTSSPLEGRLLKRSFQTRGSAKAKANSSWRAAHLKGSFLAGPLAQELQLHSQWRATACKLLPCLYATVCFLE